MIGRRLSIAVLAAFAAMSAARADNTLDFSGFGEGNYFHATQCGHGNHMRVIQVGRNVGGGAVQCGVDEEMIVVQDAFGIRKIRIRR